MKFLDFFEPHVTKLEYNTLVDRVLLLEAQHCRLLEDLALKYYPPKPKPKRKACKS